MDEDRDFLDDSKIIPDIEPIDFDPLGGVDSMADLEDMLDPDGLEDFDE